MRIYEAATGYTSVPAKVPAATELVVEELTRAMLSLGQDVMILDMEDPDRESTDLPIHELKNPGSLFSTDVRLGLIHKLRRVFYSVALAREFRRILKASPEKVILHFHNQYNMFFFLLLVPGRLRRKCLTAYTNHSGIWSLPWKEVRKTIERRYFQEVLCLKKADISFFFNEASLANACEHRGIDRRKCILIRNGVNTEIYCPISEGDRKSAERALGLEGKTLVLQVGSVNENKGQLRSVIALREILRKDPQVIFGYAGGIVSEEYQSEIRRYAEENGLTGQVRYFGVIPPGEKMNALYNLAACTIFSSHYEGFSLSIIESLSAGVPVMVREGSPFSLGKGCLTYSDASLEAVFEREILDRERLVEHKREARENALLKYSWESIAIEYLRAWEKVGV